MIATALNIIGLAILMETVTVLGRIFFGPFRARYKKWRFRYKIRIHHGYVGIAAAIFGYFYPSDLLLTLGSAAFLSDAVHHFIVLPLWVGKTEFP